MPTVHPGSKHPLVIVLSGPSGVGKDATIAGIREIGVKFHYVVTATTREKRPGEVDGVHYHFLTKRDFQEMIVRDELLEYAEVYGNFYGVPKKEVRQALEKGQDVIIKVDVQGAATLKKRIPDAVFIFLMTPSPDELVDRIKARNADSETSVKTRMLKVGEELESLLLFDYCVVNIKDDLARTAEAVAGIIRTEKHRVKRRVIKI
ncbi:MAG: guanylate kinase [Dehalococcoidia bacterium]|nr:guanylate kinase [Dehalococcoidia bacterium]